MKEQLINIIETSNDEKLIRRLFALVSGYQNQKQKELSQDETTL
ncbi:hypothetical protein J2Z76_001717 [Sedimentibacter acidaminivorans]|uniref:Uncharacterized protein n=1 Tax=Sedimentibacter acidaminivorans TaxID=913099 RepID=A0ABS4GDS6_9FIRM|nr:hypothetical protein [Sedimentibacter acidaminivorans]MBP1925856.1 hypothetical protein [Sedimentibacter acidaminivorans]